MKKIISCFFIIILISSKSFAIDTNIPKGDELYEKINNLPWRNGPFVYNYNLANSKISISDRYSVLEGEDAHQLLFWLNGTFLIM